MNRTRMDSKTSTEFTYICGLLFMLPTQVSVAIVISTYQYLTMSVVYESVSPGNMSCLKNPEPSPGLPDLKSPNVCLNNAPQVISYPY